MERALEIYVVFFLVFCSSLCSASTSDQVAYEELKAWNRDMTRAVPRTQIQLGYSHKGSCIITSVQQQEDLTLGFPQIKSFSVFCSFYSLFMRRAPTCSVVLSMWQQLLWKDVERSVLQHSSIAAFLLIICLLDFVGLDCCILYNYDGTDYKPRVEEFSLPF